MQKKCSGLNNQICESETLGRNKFCIDCKKKYWQEYKKAYRLKNIKPKTIEAIV